MNLYTYNLNIYINIIYIHDKSIYYLFWPYVRVHEMGRERDTRDEGGTNGRELKGK